MKIAISGIIGSGKSTVTKYLISKGFNLLNADEINKELLKKDNRGYLELIKVFDNILDDNNEIDKKKLANIVFNDKESLNKLNHIMHPLIKEELIKHFNQDLVIAEIPLLFETDFYELFDYYLIVVADENIVKDRLIKRGLDIDDINNRMANQLSQDIKIARANYVIYNDGDLNKLYMQVDKWLESINLC